MISLQKVNKTYNILKGTILSRHMTEAGNESTETINVII